VVKMDKKKSFNQIARDIKSVKIQGARNIAKVALKAYSLIPTKTSKKKLLSLRPTEPMMEKVLDLAEKGKHHEAVEHFNKAQDLINKSVFKLIKNSDVIFTHCHSTNVVNALIYSHKKGKKFQVYNTETRPLFQGRKTAKQLRKAGIKVTMFVDSSVAFALEKDSRKDKIYATKVFLGADALIKKGVINKIGSKVVAELAYNHKIPVYIIADSWKFTKSKVPIENRKLNEIWNNAPKNIRIQNPSFEFVDKKYIKGIVTELSLMKYNQFLKKVK
jgi:translation initiation factor 2B subunit (eIF-2B alpha/beta/delta family)